MNGLSELFSYVCGQANLWAPGGEALPFCQRCTGLYVGGAYAQALWLLFRPRPTSKTLWAHGILMLLMFPFGYHFLPQNGEVRTLTGQLFAAGLTYFLALNPALRWHPWQGGGHAAAYVAAVLAGLPLPLLAVHLGGTGTGIALAWIGVAGLIGFATLTLANLALLPVTLWDRLRRPISPRP